MDFLRGLFQPQQHLDDPISQVEQLNLLAEKSYTRYLYTQSLGDLNRSIGYYRQAVERIPSSYPSEHAGLLNNMASRLRDKYDRTTMIIDLDAACQSFRKAIELAPPTYVQRGALFSNLGIQLGEKYRQTGQIKHLEEAIRVSREAITCTPESDPDRSAFLCNLGHRLGQYYSAAGKREVLDEAVKTFRTANSSAPEGYINRHAILISLALQLGERYTVEGNVEDLNEAIVAARQAVDHTEAKHPERGDRLGTLADLLYYRFNRTGVPPQSQNGRAGHLNNLANLLLARNTRSGALSDLIEARDLIKQGIKDTPKTNVYRGAMQATLATILGTKAVQTGKSNDLDEAIQVARQVLQVVPTAHPERVRYLHNLATLLRMRYSQLMKVTDLKDAIKMAQRAIEAAPAEFPDRASLLSNLGTHLAESYSQTNIPKELEEAKKCFTSAIYHKASPTLSRVTAGRYFLLLPDILADLDQAYNIAKFTVELIPLLNSRSIQNIDRQTLLMQAVAIASDAAAVALLNNRSTIDAVQLLETGRNIIASSLQDLRTDLSMLQKEHPDLARRFVQLRGQLDVPAAKTSITERDKPRQPSREAERMHDKEEQLKILLEDIRTQPGFEAFLLAPSAEDLLAAARDGPVVIINISQFGCHALIIEPSGARTVPLPVLSWGDIHRRDRGSLETLEWLWNVIVSPVLDAMGIVKTLVDNNWSHVWWIPTGRLVGFPLHATGCHLGKGEKTALDRVVSSYSPSVKTLIHSRRQHIPMRQEQKGNEDLILVAMESTPEQGHLDHAVKEIQVICDVTKGSDIISPKEPLTYKKDVLSTLRSCSIFHFAGHGGTNSLNPLESRILLSDWKDDPLSVENILDMNLGREMPFLAYLSACGTSRIRTAGFVDEAIHMTSAFQLAGFQHVIGTLWDVNDRTCVDMDRITYDGLLKEGMSHESVSRSLHRASRELRSRWIEAEMAQDGHRRARDIVAVDEESDIRPLWVPYVHYGI
ncbi:hypothetical protein FVEN_g2124 [Fusarium venenatum]|uniref:CHAT domain-containing protein n=1 Tax=Fusarium venenatum TaxID=56646 RepID=A0A2L2SPM0_9HYPO|nr:uncharacterized protein FVRRES_12537 [Fusarium venenatum]KAG8360117.1 hypothetical protein FVEN_g2124 [Fusarium venenatum]CEI39846.1 unnamed protein product [Fusarium venenatum]